MKTRKRFASEMHALVAAILVAVWCSNQSFAQLNYVSADRSVSAVASVCDTSSDEESTMGLGTFSAMVEAFESDAMPTCQGTASSSADQLSDLAPLSIIATGTSGASAASGVIFAEGESSLTATFDITSPSPYTLSGEVDGFVTTLCCGDFAGDATIELSFGGGPVIHSVSQDTAFTPVTFDFSGILAPGTYTLEAIAFSQATVDDGSSASFDFSFDVVPEPSSVLITIGVLLCLVSRRHG